MELLTRVSLFLIYNIYAHSFYISVKIIRYIWIPNENYQIIYKAALKHLRLNNASSEMLMNLFDTQQSTGDFPPDFLF